MGSSVRLPILVGLCDADLLRGGSRVLYLDIGDCQKGGADGGYEAERRFE